MCYLILAFKLLSPHWVTSQSSVSSVNVSDFAVDKLVESCSTTQTDTVPWWSAKLRGNYKVIRVQVKLAYYCEYHKGNGNVTSV